MSRTVAVAIRVLAVGVFEVVVAVSSGGAGGFKEVRFLLTLDNVWRAYEGCPFGAMTSRHSSLIRYGSVSLISSAEDGGERADERAPQQLRDGFVFFGQEVVVDFERENGGRTVE